MKSINAMLGEDTGGLFLATGTGERDGPSWPGACFDQCGHTKFPSALTITRMHKNEGYFNLIFHYLL
jgi:hypothetical protein